MLHYSKVYLYGNCKFFMSALWMKFLNVNGKHSPRLNEYFHK